MLQNGLTRVIIAIKKSNFEVLIIAYLENAWCLVYAILHQSIVIQSNSVDVLFNGLLHSYIAHHFRYVVFHHLPQVIT